MITNLNFGFVYPLHLQFGRLVFWVKLEALDCCGVVANEMKTEFKNLLVPFFSGISNVGKDQMSWGSSGTSHRLVLRFYDFQLILVVPVNFKNPGSSFKIS